MNKKSTVCGIVAVGPGDVIGKGGVMPWHSRQDLYHFRTLTTPWPCVFGKTTFEKLPIQPLPNRLNIVCSSGYNNELKNGVFFAKSLESGIEYCKNFPYVFICGGAKVYEYALHQDLIDVMYITKIYDKKLQQNVMQHHDDYVQFPVNTDVFFDSDKWATKEIIYKDGALPKEYDDIKNIFYKCVRTR